MRARCLLKESEFRRIVGAMLSRIACLMRGGHQWQRIGDSAGFIVFCSRCGRQRHPRPAPADIHHQGHGNLGYKVTLREETGADVIEERRQRQPEP